MRIEYCKKCGQQLSRQWTNFITSMKCNHCEDGPVGKEVKSLTSEQIGLTPDVEFCNGRTKGEVFDKINELVEATNFIISSLPQELPEKV